MKRAESEPIIERRKSLAEKAAMQSRLMAELDRSMALIQLWPEVFAEGSVKTQWTSKFVGYHETRWRYTIRRSDGKARKFSAQEVPRELWHKKMLGTHKPHRIEGIPSD